MRIDVDARSRIIDGLIVIGLYFGTNGRAVDFVKKVFPDYIGLNDLERHYDRYSDWSINEVFYDKLKLLEVSDEDFIRFCEEYLNPIYSRKKRVMDENEEYCEIDYTNKCESIIKKELSIIGFDVVYNEDEIGIKTVRIISGIGGIREPIKNIIFAADKVKPDIVIDDALSNTIRVVNDGDALIYSEGIPKTGITWKYLVEWYLKNNLGKSEEEFVNRLKATLDSGVETIFFKGYMAFLKQHSDDIPALIPQVYLYYDPQLEKTRVKKIFEHQRMDFMLIISQNQRVVIELDGVQHYSVNNNCKDERGFSHCCADKNLYAEMMKAHRDMVLNGYEVYRFGGKELWVKEGESDQNVINNITDFFERLFLKHGVTL